MNATPYLPEMQEYIQAEAVSAPLGNKVGIIVKDAIESSYAAFSNHKKFHKWFKQTVPVIAKKRHPELFNKWDSLGKCCEHALPDGVNFKVGPEGQVSSSGLRSCDGQLCSNCARLIAMRNCTLLEDLIKHWHGSSLICMGGFTHDIAMLTITASHRKGSNKRAFIKKLTKAKTLFFSDYETRKLLGDYGVECQFHALETTYSEKNGMHPHYHCLLFLDRSKEERESGSVRGYWEFYEELNTIWLRVCKSIKLYSSETIGLSVDISSPEDSGFVPDDRFAARSLSDSGRRRSTAPLILDRKLIGENGKSKLANYVNKLAYEATLTGNKSSHDGGYTHMGLLHAAYNSGDLDYINVWIDISAALHVNKRKMTTMTRWSKGYRSFIDRAECEYDSVLLQEKEFEARIEYDKAFLEAKRRAGLLFDDMIDIEPFDFDLNKARCDLQFEKLLDRPVRETEYKRVLWVSDRDYKELRWGGCLGDVIRSIQYYALGVTSDDVIDLEIMVSTLNKTGRELKILCNRGGVIKIPDKIDDKGVQNERKSA